MNKSLQDKAISIKGKQYILVADRVLYFNETYPNGAINTEYSETLDRVTFKATVVPDVDKPNRWFTGFSQATWGDGMVNKTSALENAETSAVGRALGFMGIGVIEGIASVDEIHKAQNTEKVQQAAGDCPDCGKPMTLRKNGNGSYCSWKYKNACPPKEMTDWEKKVSSELDQIPVIQQ